MHYRSLSTETKNVKKKKLKQCYLKKFSIYFVFQNVHALI